MLITIDTEKVAKIIYDDMMDNLKHVNAKGIVARTYAMAAKHAADYIEHIDLWYKEEEK